jgi:lipoyl(octanoyl) transferase
MIKVFRLGLVDYSRGLQLMEEARLRVAKECGPKQGEILSLQHPAVVTLGNRPLEQDLVTSAAALGEVGVEFFKTTRGGSATVHEPGQAVVYPVLKLDSKRFGPKQLVHVLEQAMIDTAAHFGIACVRDCGQPGVWVGHNKLGALGIRVLEGVSIHGLALNVTNDLSTFRHVIPCGLRERGVTSFRNELPLKEVSGAGFFEKVESQLLTSLAGLLQN